MIVELRGSSIAREGSHRRAVTLKRPKLLSSYHDVDSCGGGGRNTGRVIASVCACEDIAQDTHVLRGNGSM